ncbi:MAG: metallophosphoesterase [Actinobacteria bacterium]|nr:metallophosphoesterase [Actinomycetota bacterium]
MSMRASRIAVLGDLSGHLKPLLTELASLGVEVDSRDVPRRVTWPDDLVVVQVGDLVHKGPVSELVVAVVESLFRRTGRWVQLVGNHEAQYLPGGIDFWQPRIDGVIAGKLREWWTEGFLRPAVAIDDDRLGPVLVSHGGLTLRSWQELGEPDHLAAAAFLADPANHDRHVLAAGQMAARDADPGVAWTEPRRELRIPWIVEGQAGRTVPFSQVHGHAQPLLPPSEGRGVPADLRRSTTVTALGHVRTRAGGREIIGIDPGAGGRPRRPRALVLSGAVHA